MQQFSERHFKLAGDYILMDAQGKTLPILLVLTLRNDNLYFSAVSLLDVWLTELGRFCLVHWFHVGAGFLEGEEN